MRREGRGKGRDSLGEKKLRGLELTLRVYIYIERERDEFFSTAYLSMHTHGTLEYIFFNYF